MNDTVSEESILVTGNVKVICPNEKRSENITYILWDFDLTTVVDIGSLTKVILDQFSCGSFSADLAFDIGYSQGKQANMDSNRC